MPSVDSTIQLIQIREQQGTQNQPSTCSSALADAPWTFDAEPTYGPGASMADHLPATAPRQPGLPAEYRNASPSRTRPPHPRRQTRPRRKARHPRPLLSARRDRPVRRLRGRLLPASQRRTHPPQRRNHRLLRRPLHGRNRRHALPSRPGRHPPQPRRRLLHGRHGRPRLRHRLLGTTHRSPRHQLTSDGRQQVIPVTYMNSSAALKGFCGEHGGVVCTSSNAAQRPRVGLRTRPARPLLPRSAPRP